MNENISIREESQPFKDLFTSLINQNLQLTNEVKQIKTQINDQYEHLTQQTKDSQLKIDRLEQELNQQIQNNENLNEEFNFFEQNLNQQIKEGRIVPYIFICLFIVFVISEIDQLKQSLNEQIQINQNLTNKLNLVEGNLKRHSDHLTKLDNDQQESAIQSKQHFTQQTTNLQLEIDQLKQKLNQQNDHLTKLDNDQQESSNQSKQHLQLIQHRENYHSEF